MTLRRQDPVGHHILADEVANVGEVETEHGNEDEDASQQRIKEELDRGILAPRTTPDADEEIHRQQHDFPEDVEQEEVERQKRSHHPGFKDQKQDAVAAHHTVDLPAGDHGQETQHGGEEDERHADPVDAKIVVNAKACDPWAARDPIVIAVPL